MPQYFFILGKNPTLSVAEIISVLDKSRISFSVKTLSAEVLIISSKEDLQPVNLMQTLGGTIKIGKVINEVSFEDDEQEFEKIFEVENLVSNYLFSKTGKTHFGISVYGTEESRNYLSKIVNQLKNLNITIKENLRKKRVKAGFVQIKERFLSSVSVWKNKLLSAGFEMVLIVTKDSILAGKTLTVQEFESFSFRDYGRPQRDKRSGIIPPKLARMMINLVQTQSTGLLLDPFCGSGTILQEAIILEYKNIVGTDISVDAVNHTKKNIEWLFANFRQLNKSLCDVDIYQSDIRTITQKIKNNSIDAIVTEPFLGPPLFQIPTTEMIDKILTEVEELYLATFDVFHKILKVKGKVVFVFPAFEMSGKMHFVPILDKIEKKGFKKIDLLPLDLEANPVINLTGRKTILYGGPEHFVKREIVSWQKA